MELSCILVQEEVPIHIIALKSRQDKLDRDMSLKFTSSRDPNVGYTIRMGEKRAGVDCAAPCCVQIIVLSYMLNI